VEKYIVRLSKKERMELLSLIKKGKASAYKLLHGRILLGVDESEYNERPQTDASIAQILHVDVKTVKRVRKRCVEEGIEAALLRKRHRRTKPRKLDGEGEAHLIALCCSKPPEGRARWTLKLLSERLVSLEIVDGIAESTVRSTLKKTN
jgi:transposase